MKQNGKILATIFFFTSVLSSMPALTDTEARKEFTDVSRRELAELTVNAAKSDSLGEWTEIINSSLFLLFRRTELYRGQLQSLVVENSSIVSKLYPDGTFVLSTGLLDYIDTTIFETASESARRMRNFNAEREMMLVPFLVTEASRFALDFQFKSFQEPSSANTLESDVFAYALLTLAGYNPSLYENSLMRLKDMYGALPQAENFHRYFALLPSPETRLTSIAENGERIENTVKEIAIIVSNVRAETAFRETMDSLDTIRKDFPISPYLDRLEAISLHRQWLTTVPAKAQRLQTIVPVAATENKERALFLALFDSPPPSFPSPAVKQTPTAIPGDVTLYKRAIDCYERALGANYDPTIASSYAMLLSQSGSSTDCIKALKIAENAVQSESGLCFTARINYSSLLFLTGTDYAKAQFLAKAKYGTKQTDGVDQGIPGDERDILLNYTLMLRYLGDTNAWKERKTALDSLLAIPLTRVPISLRSVRIGDTIDELVTKWGHPSKIDFDGYTEKWGYPTFSASVSVVRDLKANDTQIISQISLEALSPISPGGDVRTGDKRVDFEKVFGSPLYFAEDRTVYRAQGNQISVLYLADTIRSMLIE